MSQHYSNPTRESDPHALPDVEVFETRIVHIECPHCGDFERPDGEYWEDITCPSCTRPVESVGYVSMPDSSQKWGWFWHSCFPGCLPDSEPMGPFETRAEAIADAQANAEDFQS